MRYAKKFILATVFALAFSYQTNAQNERFRAKEFTDSKGTLLKYRILYPENYNPNKKYPLILFLHGAGE